MSKAINVDYDFLSASKITNLPAAVANGQPVRFEEFQAVIQGLAWKDDVRAAAAANVNLASPGTAIDGVTLANGDRFLTTVQTDQTQNGIYIFNGSSTPATRATDMDASSEFNAAVVPVDAGGTANGNTRWRATVTNPTVGTTAITFVADQTAAPQSSETTSGTIRTATQAEVDAGTLDAVAVSPLKLATWAKGPKRFSQNVGDGSSTSFTVTHNLNTEDVEVYVRETTGNKRQVDVEIRDAGVNAVTVLTNTIIASGAYRVTCLA